MATSTGTKRPPDAAPEGPAAKKPTGVTVALREGDTQMPPYPANPAKQYPFELDPFQRDAITRGLAPWVSGAGIESTGPSESLFLCGGVLCFFPFFPGLRLCYPA